MPKLRILYIGAEDGTSRHRCRALQRLGHDVLLVNPYLPLATSPWASHWYFKTGYWGAENAVRGHVLKSIAGATFDVTWVDNGDVVGRSLVRELRSRSGRTVVHNLDNPYPLRHRGRWRLFHGALPEYDLFVTPRESTRVTAVARGARRAAVVMQSSDEIVHRRRVLTDSERARFGSEVVFVGTFMPGRDAFMRALIERGVPLRIFGSRWHKADEFRHIRQVVTDGFQADEEYARVISGAKIALALLSADNQDLHTTRSLEIPAIGTLLCAPRTKDHELLYHDGSEACFFDTAEECAEICRSLLADDDRRSAIAAAGHLRARQNGRFNERVAGEILDLLTASG